MLNVNIELSGRLQQKVARSETELMFEAVRQIAGLRGLRDSHREAVRLRYFSVAPMGWVAIGFTVSVVVSAVARAGAVAR